MRPLWILFLKGKGWRTDIIFPYNGLKKFIIIFGPHTSNWDFLIGLAYRNTLKMKHVRYLGKQELFRPPFGFIFRWLGGYPVDRRNNHNLVESVASLFANHDSFALALSPEGTRKKVDKLKTGFYYIARQAGVPIIMAGLDYKNKQAIFSEPLRVTSDQVADFERIHSFYRSIEGRIPEAGLMHL